MIPIFPPLAGANQVALIDLRAISYFSGLKLYTVTSYSNLKCIERQCSSSQPHEHATNTVLTIPAIQTLEYKFVLIDHFLTPVP
jgi:hypothetical protein